MEIRYSKLAIQQRDLIKKSGDKLFQIKISRLIIEIEENPTIGIGHTERLKGYKIPTYSRRIDKKNRLIYSLLPDENAIEILCWGTMRKYNPCFHLSNNN